MANKCFVMIPLPMIKVLFQTPNAFEKILSTGIYKSAFRQRIAGEDRPLMQMVYCWYAKKECLTASIREKLEELLKQDVWFDDDCYRGFDTNGNFTAGVELYNGLFDYVKKDNDFFKAIEEWYAIYQFNGLIGFSQGGEQITRIIERADTELAKDNTQPYALVNPNTFFYHAKTHTKERERARLAMGMAISTIVGSKEFAATSKSQIAMRMFGCKNDEELEKTLQDHSLKECYDRYTTRKIFDRLRDDLLEKGYIKCYHGHAGKVYVSTRNTVDKLDTFIKKEKKQPNRSWKADEKALNKRLTDINKGTSLGTSQGTSQGASP